MVDVTVECGAGVFGANTWIASGNLHIKIRCVYNDNGIIHGISVLYTGVCGVKFDTAHTYQT